MYSYFIILFYEILISVKFFLLMGSNMSPLEMREPRMETPLVDQLRPILINRQFQDYMQTDWYLTRWLKEYVKKTRKWIPGFYRRIDGLCMACDMSLACATDMLEKSFKWREENEMANIMSENLNADMKYFPYEITGFDRAGDPIALVDFGKWDYRKYVLAGKIETTQRVWLQFMEKLESRVHDVSLRTNTPNAQAYLLIDASGYSLKRQACYGCIQALTRIMTSQDLIYPFIFKNLTAINAPRIIAPLVALAKSLLSGQTSKAINVYGSVQEEWRPLVLKDIDPEQIPSNYGGNI